MLDALSNLLAAGDELGKAKGENEFTKAFDEAEGVDKLEALQEHKNADIYDKARATRRSHAPPTPPYRISLLHLLPHAP